uniref:Putative PAS/PAC sensor protein n=1 Tax=Desulfovibrio desulfuricans (strain ATCC 27774 / DSM 6949 / MB) TaxID=525146 RepID=B8IZY1_DESDA
MKIQEMDVQSVVSKYQLRKAVVAAVSLAIFLVASAVAYVLCTLQLRNVTQDVLNSQREIEQVWLEKSLEAVHTWRNGLVEQARFVSSAEMFRLYAVDVRNLGPDGAARLAAPDAQGSGDEALRSLAEQLPYMQDLLRDFAKSRQWTAARIVLPDGQPLVIQEHDAALGEAQIDMVRRAIAGKSIVFGPVRALGQNLVMDLADPLYEVLGQGSTVPVAALLATIPVDRALASFLSLSQEQYREIRQCIVQQHVESMQVISLRGGKADLFPYPADLQEGSLAFKRRQGIAEQGEVYSLGSYVSAFNWWMVLEVPVGIVDSVLESQSRQIYGLGVLGSLGTALLVALVWAGIAGRSYRATARHFQRLYALIKQQKLMLDSVNASLQAGLMLADSRGRLQMCNPAFSAMTGKSETELVGSNLCSVLPDSAAETLMEGMQKVAEEKVEGSLELSLGQDQDARLYRVTLFPFEDSLQGEISETGGCVGIFQDITEFRRRAEAARERQASSIAALVRAIESVDVNLIGHSQKMEQVVELLAGSLDLPDKDRETLRLAARLSQVGKIFVPHHLLIKTGKLTPEEQKEVMRAPEYAYRALCDLQFGLPVPDAVYQMGERLDGTGQPRKLSGNDITPNARILAVVNAFCAMVSPRSYRAGMEPQEAIILLKRDQGFDQDVVAALATLPVDSLQKAIAATEKRHVQNGCEALPAATE